MVTDDININSKDIFEISNHLKIAQHYIDIVQQYGLENLFVLKELDINTMYKNDILLEFESEEVSWYDFVIDPHTEIVTFKKDAIKEIKNTSLDRKTKNKLFAMLKTASKKQEAAGRAHSYIFGLLEYLRRKKGNLVFKEALQLMGLNADHIKRMRKKPTEKNSYILEQAIMHLVLYYFGDLTYEEKEKIIWTISIQSSTLELLPNRKGFLERKLIPFFIMSKIVGKFSRGNSTISFGKSYNLKRKKNTEAKGLSGLFRRKQRAQVSYTYYNAPILEKPWLHRPEKIINEEKTYYPTKETVYKTGLIDYYTSYGAVAATVGVAIFKKITEGLETRITEYCQCPDQFEHFFDGKRYRMNEDGNFYNINDSSDILTDSTGEYVSYFKEAFFAFDKENNKINDIDKKTIKKDKDIGKYYIINSKRMTFLNYYERTYKYGKFKIDISKDINKPYKELTFLKNVIPSYFARKGGFITAVITTAIMYFLLKQELVTVDLWWLILMVIFFLGISRDRLLTWGINIRRYYEGELKDDRERDNAIQERQQDLYLNIIKSNSEVSEERKKLNSILDSLTSGIVSVNLKEKILDANASFCRYTRFTKEQLIGKNFSDFFHPEDYAKIVELLHESIEKKDSKYNEIVMAHIGNEKRFLKTIISPVFDDNEKISLNTITFEDRTKRRKTEIMQREQTENESQVNQKILMAIGDANPLIDAIISDSKDFADKLNEINNIVHENMKNSEEFLKSLSGLQHMSSELINFINLIVDVSDRTHLISLNASIEAAKAGEHGQAFAVVAKEINKLADQSKEGSAQQQQEIDNMIELLQKLHEWYQKINERFIQLTKLINIISNNAKENEKRAGDAQDSMQQIKGTIKESVMNF
jgi:PAS domain S-box-containing protein